MNKELEPCPFCENTEVYTTNDGKYCHYVECIRYQPEYIVCCRGPVRTTKQEAIDAWNKRTSKTLHLVVKEGEFRKEKKDGDV